MRLLMDTTLRRLSALADWEWIWRLSAAITILWAVWIASTDVAPASVVASVTQITTIDMKIGLRFVLLTHHQALPTPRCIHLLRLRFSTFASAWLRCVKRSCDSGRSLGIKVQTCFTLPDQNC